MYLQEFLRQSRYCYIWDNKAASLQFVNKKFNLCNLFRFATIAFLGVGTATIHMYMDELGSIR